MRIAVSATEALCLIQHTICLVGNASDLTSVFQREKILTALDLSWSRFGSEEFSMKDMLFGEEFQSLLTSMVEKETALAKAVSRHKKGKELPSQQDDRAADRPCLFVFLKGAPPGKYRDRRGKNF